MASFGPYQPIPSNVVPVDRALIDQAIDLTDTLVHLNFLICAQAEQPLRVRSYSTRSEEHLQQLARLLQSLPSH